MPSFDRAPRAALRALVVSVLAVAPASLAAQNSCVGDSTDVEVRGLEFRGNRALGDRELSLRVQTTPSAWLKRTIGIGGTKRCFSPTVLWRDALGLRRYYQSRGFLGATVDTSTQRSRRGVRAIFTINEGAPTLLTRYDVTGLDGLPDSADIMRRLRLRVGERWDLGFFQADIDSIQSRLRNAGYFRATVFSPARDSDPASRTAQASITVIPGKPARFGDPDVVVTPAANRTQQISDETVKRLLGIRPGTLFSDDAIRDAQRNLFQIGTYRQLEVQADPNQPSDTIVNYTVRLTEDYMHNIDSEFGWATLDCFRTRVQYTNKNLFGSARRMELTGQATKLGYAKPFHTWPTRDFCNVKLGSQLGIADDQFSDSLHYFLGATFRQPRLLGTRVTPALSIYSERRGEYRAYLRHTELGGDVSGSLDLADRMPLRIGYSIEYGYTIAPDAALCALFNRCDPGSRDFLKARRPLGVASLGLSRVRTDNPLSPTRGTTFRAELRSAQPWLLTPDTQSFNKATADIAHYLPIGRNVLALRLRGGAVRGRQFAGSLDFIPPQERLYAGGPTSVRGFQQNELGEVVYLTKPRDDVDSTEVAPGQFTYFVRADTADDGGITLRNPERTAPLGGNSLVVANVEFRTRLPFLLPNLLQFMAFVDGGDVWSRGGTLNLKWTPGLGVRASTPIGPVQVNVAQNVAEREAGQLFYNPDVSTLACATPGNNLVYTRTGGQLEQVGTGACPSYKPGKRTGFRRLTFTFSIGSDF